MADIITMPTSLDALAERIRRACKVAIDNREAWIAATIDLATAFAAARDRLTADQQYHAWCIENELDIVTRDDRAALVNMARHLDLTRIVLAETKRSSWLLIWREEILPRCRNAPTPENATAAPAVAPRRRRSEPPPMAPADLEAANRIITALDTLLRSIDGVDLAAAQRGLTGTQRRQVETLKRRVRNWLDILEISK